MLEVEEVELCYIPMGGALPRKDQRVVAFGGSAGLVHPSTGYQICRALAAAGPTAAAIAKEVRILEKRMRNNHVLYFLDLVGGEKGVMLQL